MMRRLFWPFALIAFLAAACGDEGQQNAGSTQADPAALLNPLGAQNSPPQAATPGTAAPQTDQVFVNRVALDRQTLAALAQSGAPQPGRYWYDPISGLWGLEGGPYMGRLSPGLNLGGPLPADISGGGTGTFINGREIHPLEYQALQAAFGTVYPGRFWLQPDGWIGPEGGGPLVNLAQSAKPGSGGGAWSSYSSFGGTVGQDSNGCTYFAGTGGDYNSSWSNC